MPFAQATLLVAKPDLQRLRAPGRIADQPGAIGWFDLSTQLAFEVAGTENSIYRGTALRTDLVLLAGHYGRRWFAVAEAGYDRAWLTYIENSDYYRSELLRRRARRLVRRRRRAGCTRAPRAASRIGAVEVVLRAGVNKTETLQDLDLPFYATLGANYRF